MLPLSLAKAISEPAKVMAPMATPRLISIRLWVRMAPSAADAEGVGRIERRAGDQHRGQADQRMERRHQLRHGGHGDAPGHHRADAAADGEAADDQAPGQRIGDARHPQGGERWRCAMPIMPLRLPARDWWRARTGPSAPG